MQAEGSRRLKKKKKKEKKEKDKKKRGGENPRKKFQKLYVRIFLSWQRAMPLL